MRDEPGNCSFEAAVRRAFVDLVYDALPAAACRRDWPVTTPEGFERLLLDHALGAPFETCLRAGPTAAMAGLMELLLAVETGGRMLEGRCCVAELDRRSRAMRCAEPAAAPEPRRQSRAAR